MEIIRRTAVAAWSERHKIFRYVISGLAAAVVNIFIIYAATDWLGIWYLASSVLAFLGAICVSFTLQKFWTFKNNSTSDVHRQMLMYVIFALFTICFNTLLVYLEVQYLGVHYVLAQIISNAILALINFFVYKKIVFVI